jgi:hypothetical protein
VERPFFYLEQQFIKGNAWDSFDHFGRNLAAFCSGELDHMVHSTTQERPIDRFQQEKTLLTLLPALPFISTGEEMRKVSWDCLLSYEGSRYSVPWRYAAKNVWVRPYQGLNLIVRNQRGEEIATHKLSAIKGATIIDPAHCEGLRKDLPKTKALLEEMFLRFFPDHKWFCDAVFIQHKTNAAAHLRGILSLIEVYPHEILVLAFAAARECNTYSHRFIRGILEAKGSYEFSLGLSATGAQRPAQTSQVGADLGVYQDILEAAR